MKQIAIGIDLGTTNTVAFCMKNGRPTPIKFVGSGNILPSIIYVDEDGGVLVGNAAKTLCELDAANGVRLSKIYMGDAGKKWICRGREFTPTDVATEILKFVRQAVIQKFQCDANTEINAVITVPVGFSAAQIDATRKAGEATGFDVVRIITEPIAAAAAVTDLETSGKVMVVDFDDTKLAMSLLEIDSDSLKTLAHIRNNNLGSEYFYAVLEKYLLNKINRDTGKNLTSSKEAGADHRLYSMIHGRLRSAAISAIEDLQNSTGAYIYLPSLFSYDGEMYNFDVNLTREKFDELSEDIYAEIFKQIDELIAEGKIDAQDFNEIILIGDDYCAPYIRDEIERRFNKRLNMELEPSILVAYGACLLADRENHRLEKRPEINYDAKKNRILEKLASTQKFLDKLRVEAEEKIRELDQRRLDLENEYRQKNAELEREHEKCRQRLAELNEKIELQESQLEVLANTQEILDAALAEQRQKNPAFQAQENVEMEKTRADLLQQYLDDANREIDELKGKLESSGGEFPFEADTQENVEMEKTRADLLQQYLDDANREIDELKGKLENSGGEFPFEADTQENVEMEKTRADLLQQYLDDANKKIEELEEKIGRLTEAVASAPFEMPENLKGA